MRILYTNFHPGDGGGHTSYIASLAKSLSGIHDIVVAAPVSSKLNGMLRRHNGKIRVVDVDFPGKPREAREIIRNLKLLKHLVATEQFDVIHVNGSPDHRMVMLATALSFHRRPRIVFTKHNSLPVSRDFGTFLRSRYFTDHTIAVSAYTARQLADTYYAQNGITVIRNGIDTDHFCPVSQESMRTARSELLGVGAETVVMGSVAGTDEHKGWLTLVRAVAQVPLPLRERVRVVVLGAPPSRRLVREVEELGMTKQVIFPGLVNDVRPWISAFDIGFVLSQGIETISFACREMMAMGKPVLVSDYAGLPENVDHGANGWIVGTRDPKGVAELLAGILAHPGRLVPMGAEAREKADKEFKTSQFVEATEAVYSRVAGRGNL